MMKYEDKNLRSLGQILVEIAWNESFEFKTQSNSPLKTYFQWHDTASALFIFI